jgi:hypothetical protein
MGQRDSCAEETAASEAFRFLPRMRVVTPNYCRVDGLDLAAEERFQVGNLS